MTPTSSGAPIDRGWAWIVVLAAFMNLLFLVGISKCFGIIFAELMETYHGMASSTSVMLALSAGLSLFLAPVTTTLCDIYTCRRIAMIGGVLCCMGFFLPAFCNSLEQIVFAFGILTGLGYGMCLNPSTIMVGRYFDRYRSLANGLMFSGSGVGGMVLPLFVSYIIDLCGLHGAFLVMASIAIHTIVFSSFYRPLEYWSKIDHSKSAEMDEGETEGALTQDQSRDEDQYEALNGGIVDNCHLRHHHSISRLQSDKQDETWNGRLEQRSRAPSDTTVYFSTLNLVSWLSVPDIRYGGISHRDNSAQTEDTTDDKKLTRSPCWRILRRTCVMKTADGLEKPLFNIGLLKNIRFLLFILGCMFLLSSVHIAMIIPPHCLELGMTKTQVAFLLTAQGGADTTGRLLAGILGDRAYIKSRRKWLLTVCCFICSVATLISIFLTTFWSLMAYLVITSFALGSFVSNMPVTLVELVGVENLSGAWGLTMFMEGFSITLSPMIIGALRDITLTYQSGLIFFTTCLSLATICVCSVAILERNDKRNCAKATLQSNDVE